MTGFAYSNLVTRNKNYFSGPPQSRKGGCNCFVDFGVMHQSLMQLPPPPIRAWAGHSLFIKVKVSEVSGPRGQQGVLLSPVPTVPHTHGTPFVKQLINETHGLKDTVGSHEVKTLTVERSASKLKRLVNAEWMSKYLYCGSSFIDTSRAEP